MASMPDKVTVTIVPDLDLDGLTDDMLDALAEKLMPRIRALILQQSRQAVRANHTAGPDWGGVTLHDRGQPPT